MTREEGLVLVREYIKNEGLVRHCLAVEAAMRAYAPRYAGDVDTWGLTGLLHDFDWEIHPSLDQHPHHGSPILRERGVPEPIIHAILTHADYLNIPRVIPMEKALAASDELTGLITAATLVRPNKSIHGLDVPSIKKKFKDKSFARQVNRDDITRGAAELGVDMDAHIGFVLEAMQGAAISLGLEGLPA
ncbi:MAG TPA: HDIG domain-containing protein [Chloroflexota bacterium]|nr:HDIG domain-containing protein [Chloroflexota bacterium]